MSEVNDDRAALSDAAIPNDADAEPTLPFRPVNAPSVPKGLTPELANHPRYRVVALLDEGGMGTVYRAEHRLMKRPVALKVINARLINCPNAVERFRREVQTAARLSHPNIVTIYDADAIGDAHFLVMELVDGVTLDRLVARKGVLPVARACDYVRQASLGLQHAQEQGMVHRDIKPNNLMLTRKGQVKILDFGLARFVSVTSPDGVLTESGTIAGTPDYIAPEQAEDAHKADIRADIYSLGCTLYFLLTGQPPFPQGTVLQKLLAHQTRSPRPLVTFRDDVPSDLIEVFERMTAKDPARRYQTPAEVARALLPIVQGARRLAENRSENRKAATLASEPEKACPSSGEEPASLSRSESSLEQARTVADAPSTTVPNIPSRSRPRTKKKRQSRRSRMVVVGIGLAFGLLLLVGVGSLIALMSFRAGRRDLLEPVVGPAVDHAEVSLRSEVPEAEVVVRHDGRVIQTLRPGPGQRLILPPGEYDFQLTGEGSGYRLSANRLVLAPGDRRDVDVQWDDPSWRPKGGRPPGPGFPPPRRGFPPPRPGFPPPPPGPGREPPP